MKSKYDKGAMRRAAELVDAGAGARTIARELGLPLTTAEQWVYSYRAVGLEVFLTMGERKVYPQETKVAAVEDFLGGTSKADVMARHGIASVSPLNSWIRKYREGGPAALAPAPKGRPPGSAAKRAPETREEQLEEENRLLRTEVAYLKKLRALREGRWTPGAGAR